MSERVPKDPDRVSRRWAWEVGRAHRAAQPPRGRVVPPFTAPDWAHWWHKGFLGFDPPDEEQP